jgi:hypothetical protein
VVILGNAPTNKPVTTKIEGIDLGGEYGGSNAADNSGSFRYVRIEYPGIVISLNNEINGLTLGGVGSGTTIDHVQVTNSGDDSFEWFGGTVNAKYLIAVNGTDDDFDTDFGYSGLIQFAFGKRDANLWDAAGQSNGFESDNDGTPTTAVPLTSPIFSNVTLVGPQSDTNSALPVGHKFEYGAVIRRNTRLSVHNSVIMGYPFGFSIRNDSTAAYASAGYICSSATSVFRRARTYLQLQRSPQVSDSPSEHSSEQRGWNNLGGTPRQPSALSLVDVFNAANPDPRPTVGSEAATAGTSFSSTQLSNPFFTQVSYRGAFDPSQPRSAQWDAGWTNYNPNNKDYSTSVKSSISAQSPGRVFTGTELSESVQSFHTPSTMHCLFPANVTLKVYNLIGQEVASLVNEFQREGSYDVRFDASKLSSGVYFYSLSAGNFTQVKKMMLVK